MQSVIRQSSTFVISAIVFLSLQVASANPVGGIVVGGQANINSPADNQVVVNQGSDNAVIDWRSFNIASGETTTFNQPNASAIALNRVTDGQMSQVQGHLNANGNVWLINPAGVVFGENAQVNVGGLLATTADVNKTGDSMVDHGLFELDHGLVELVQKPDSTASIINHGKINAGDGGLVALLGAGVENDGLINVKHGIVGLASGKKYQIQRDPHIHGRPGEPRTTLSFGTDGAVDKAPVDEHGNVKDAAVTTTNRSIIRNEGGNVLIVGFKSINAVHQALNLAGVIDVSSTESPHGSSPDGRLVVLASGNYNADGSCHMGAQNKIDHLKIKLKQGNNQGSALVFAGVNASISGSTDGELELNSH